MKIKGKIEEYRAVFLEQALTYNEVCCVKSEKSLILMVIMHYRQVWLTMNTDNIDYFL